MKLHYLPGACSLADHIVLEWIGKPYQAVAVPRDQLKSPGYLRVNPAGSVPALELVDRWLAFVNADVHPSFWPFFGGLSWLQDEAMVALGHEAARKKLRGLFERADRQLDGRDWIAGTRSIADPYLFVVTRWARAKQVDLSGLDNLERHFQRMQADPAVQRVLEAEGL